VAPILQFLGVGMRSWDPEHSSRAPFRSRLSWRLALFVPGLFPGAVLHHAALWVAASGARDLAQRLFDAAAGRYRHELRIEPLVRLRIHQRMLGMLDADPGGPDPSLEVERGLLSLSQIESPRPPFPMVDSRSLVGTWPSLVSARFAAPRHHDAFPHRAAA
jgi:hypothetical protein